MKIDLKTNDIPQSQQTKTEQKAQSLHREKSPTLHVKTDVSAGWYPGMYWDDWTANWLSKFR